MAATASTRAEQKARTRRALLDAGRRIVDERGAGGLSLREVAREAGVVPTAFYRHFRDLDELRAEVAGGAAEGLGAVVAAAGLGEAVDVPSSRAAVDRLSGAAAQRRDLLRGAPLTAADGPAAQRERARARLDRVADDLRVDLARDPALAHLDAPDLAATAGLLLDTALRVVAAVLDEVDAAAQQRVRDDAVRRLLVVRRGAVAAG